MLNHSKPILSAAVVLGFLGSALPALAEKDYELLEPYGGPTQSWQDIERSRQDIQRQIQREYHTDKNGNAYGYIAPPSQKHRPLHKHGRDAHDR